MLSGKKSGVGVLFATARWMGPVGNIFAGWATLQRDRVAHSLRDADKYVAQGVAHPGLLNVKFYRMNFFLSNPTPVIVKDFQFFGSVDFTAGLLPMPLVSAVGPALLLPELVRPG